MKCTEVQHNYIVAKSFPATFHISTWWCHSYWYRKVSYPLQR